MDDLALLQQKVGKLETLVFALIKSDRYTFDRNIQMMDGRNVQLATGTGTKIGTATSQKLAFWNKTPIIQPASANQAAVSLYVSLYESNTGSDTVNLSQINNNFVKINANFGDVGALLNQLRTDLIAVGIIKGSA